ncbi:MAG: Lrp/AsnC family transcriptional regulator [Caldilineales bacterium]|nr:Lrp/AsnC family transcriptional regulator [Caldilineales bacterium]
MLESKVRLLEGDHIDRAILQTLQENARISNADLARQVNLSPPAVHARVRRLEEQGLIRKYVALLDREAAGYDMLCLISVRLERHQRRDIDRLRAVVQEMPEVLECFHVTGEFDFLLKVVMRNRQELERFVVDRLSSLAGIAHIRTSLVLSEIKSTTALPL